MAYLFFWSIYSSAASSWTFCFLWPSCTTVTLPFSICHSTYLVLSSYRFELILKMSCEPGIQEVCFLWVFFFLMKTSKGRRSQSSVLSAFFRCSFATDICFQFAVWWIVTAAHKTAQRLWGKRGASITSSLCTLLSLSFCIWAWEAITACQKVWNIPYFL